MKADISLIVAYTKYINADMVLAVASNPTEQARASKLKIRPVKLRGAVMYQVTATVGRQEKHENLGAEETVALLAEVTGTEFRQIEIGNDRSSLVVMVSKKGTCTVKEHFKKQPAQNTTDTAGKQSAQNTTDTAGKQSAQNTTDTAGKQSAQNTTDTAGKQSAQMRDIAGNNRKKEYVLPEGEPVPFLVELGVMTRTGKVTAQYYNKFRQINRYLEFVEDIVPSLPKGRELSIIDFGCGKSYLTFALYYYLHDKCGLDVRITGLDLKEDVIRNCNELAVRFGYEKLSFLHGDIADYEGQDAVDMVVTLHACDTATDYALYKAILWKARVIFCVPCCQHELNRQIADDRLKDVLKYGLIKERMAALVTDSFRACILEEQGYRTQILEFIDMEHTPKNILIRAVRQDLRIKGSAGYKELMKELHVEPTLYRLLHEQEP